MMHSSGAPGDFKELYYVNGKTFRGGVINSQVKFKRISLSVTGGHMQNYFTAPWCTPYQARWPGPDAGEFPVPTLGPL